MKMKVMVKEVENEGLEALMGQRVTLFCGVYSEWKTKRIKLLENFCLKITRRFANSDPDSPDRDLYQEARDLCVGIDFPICQPTPPKENGNG